MTAVSHAWFLYGSAVYNTFHQLACPCQRFCCTKTSAIKVAYRFEADCEGQWLISHLL